MAQIQKGDTFADGQQVTGARLNQLIDSAILLPNVIVDQPYIASGTLVNEDLVLIYDMSADALKKSEVRNFLSSGLDISTTSISSPTDPTFGTNIKIKPSALLGATSATYVASQYGNIYKVIVTSTNHGLFDGDWVTIQLADSAYNGIYQITVTSVNGFEYQVPALATILSGSLQWIKEGGLIVGDRENNLSLETGNITAFGSETIGGNLIVKGTSQFNGKTYNFGEVIQNGTVTQNGTVNITGAIQYNGTPIFGLYSTTTNSFTNMSSWGTTNGYVRIPSWSYNWYLTTGNLHGTDVFVVPENEIWEVSYSAQWNNPISQDPWSVAILLNDAPVHSVQQISYAGWQSLPAVTTKFLVGGNGTTGVTYTFKFKSTLVGGTGGTDYISLDAWNVGSRTIKKYKTA